MEVPIREFAVGATARRQRLVTEADVQAFAELSGDRNPLHLDPEYAAKTIFGECIAHGIFSAALVSAVIGNDLPGPGTIYVSQTMSFKAPVKIGDTITAQVTVTEDSVPSKGKYVLSCSVKKQDGTEVLAGTATVLYRPVE
jgi:acyl dehydratase